MDCDDVRHAVSARLDGEDPGLPDPQIDNHLDSCRSCRAWQDDLEALHRLVRVREADAVPDLTTTVLQQAGIAARHRARPAARALVPGARVGAARWALFVVAVTQLVLAAPALVTGDDPAGVHVARELGAFDVALAIGLLVAAWQPARAWGLLPVAAALGVVLAGTAVFDVVDGSASSAGEAHHLLDLAGVGLLWTVARGGGGRRPTLSPA